MANRLAEETSPYLLQHAQNPVDWHPWGPEALHRAREQERPILLSIGYAACHWCHVMAHESFEDPDTAAMMNEAFVNVKVDREERPDLDSIYMRAVQAMTGHGGWPLTIFLTPEGRPFYGGTYFPPEPRHGMPSFRQVLRGVSDAWRERRDALVGSAESIAELLERSTRPSGPMEEQRGGAELGSLLAEATRRLLSTFDPVRGGFGGAPKFPQPVVLDFLLAREGTDESSRSPSPREAVVTTLERMAAGGIRDHLGGGFHRYSVDARWHVPHFEKMLYDQALVARSYLHAAQSIGSEELLAVAAETLDYVLGDLRSPEGGFYSARDADSDGEEGRFYVWTPEEVDAHLDREEARLVRRVYDVSEPGSFEGRSILHLPHDLPSVARREGIPLEELTRTLASARERLLRARERRTPPLRDEKVLAGWNGMMIRTLAEASAVIDDRGYLEAACAGAEFVLDRMREEGRLLHTFKEGRARIPGFLEDYAALGNALLTLHEVTLEERWLADAEWCAERTLDLFFDEEAGVFFDTARDGEPLVVRPRDPSDTATPSGTSLAAEFFWRMGWRLDREEWRSAAEAVVTSEAAALAQVPAGFGRLLSVADQVDRGPVEISFAGDRSSEAFRALHRAAVGVFQPRRVIASAEGGDGAPRPVSDRAGPPPSAGATASGAGPQKGARESPYAVVCRDFACAPPVSDPAALATLVRG